MDANIIRTRQTTNSGSGNNRLAQTKTKSNSKSKSNPKTNINEIDQDYEDYSVNKLIDDKTNGMEAINDIDDSDSPIELTEKDKIRIKRILSDWLDQDDKIKEMRAKIKELKQIKKKKDIMVMKMIEEYKIGENQTDKIDFRINPDDKKSSRGKIYRHVSVRTDPINKKIVLDALNELFEEEDVMQIIDKINSKRTVKEQHYIKRTGYKKKK
jgi:hypothetical protein